MTIDYTPDAATTSFDGQKYCVLRVEPGSYLIENKRNGWQSGWFCRDAGHALLDLLKNNPDYPTKEQIDRICSEFDDSND